MFSIYDAAAEIFHPPFYKPTAGVAERDFEELCQDPKSTLNKRPEHFDLFYIGDYDDSTGKMTTLATPQHQIKAISCVKKQHMPDLEKMNKPDLHPV